jgi:hypothetical protein
VLGGGSETGVRVAYGFGGPLTFEFTGHSSIKKFFLICKCVGIQANIVRLDYIFFLILKYMKIFS